MRILRRVRLKSLLRLITLYEWASYCMNGQFQMGVISPTKYCIYVAFFLGILFAMIGRDFAVEELALVGRDELVFSVNYFLLWQLHTIGLTFFMIYALVGLNRWSRFEALNPWLKLIMSGALGSAVFAPIGLGADLCVGLEEQIDGFWKGVFAEWIDISGTAIIAWTALNAPWVMGFSLHQEQPNRLDTDCVDQSHREVALVKPKFMSLLPEDKQGELIYLKSELHYVDVVTDKGNALILYNLKDAINDYGDEAGFAPHRSFWAVTAQVSSFEKLGRQGHLYMKNGDRIPVSRRALDRVKQVLA